MQPSSIRTCSISVTTSVLAIMVLTPVLAVDVVDDPIQIDDCAAQLMHTSNSLCWEMYRFHQHQPGYQQAYRQAKEVWQKAGELRDALRANPVETELLIQEVDRMSNTFKSVESMLLKWQDGDRSQLANNSGPTQRTVVTGGAEIDLPFVGISVGRPRLTVTEDGPPQLERHRLHVNSPGSKRSLERQLVAVNVALSYLVEDANTVSPANLATVEEPAATTTENAPQESTGPKPDPTLNEAAPAPAEAPEDDAPVIPVPKKESTPKDK